MKIVLFEDAGYRNLLPLVYWRTVGELRVGYGQLVDRVRVFHPQAELAWWCRPELAAVAADRLAGPINTPATGPTCFLNARLLLDAPVTPPAGPAVQWADDALLAAWVDDTTAGRLTPAAFLEPDRARTDLAGLPDRSLIPTPCLIRYPWDLVHANPQALAEDWNRMGRPADILGRVCDGAHLLNPAAIHVGRDSVLKPGVVLDAEHGPIYIGERVTVCPNVSIEGPCYIGDGSLIQPGAVLRDGMSIGRRCKVGGELESSIIHGFSNKQHDGFLGHSYVAEWVNLAADTVNSDLKNTYGTIRVPINGTEVESGQMFVGLTIGDHAKTGIGQMFPTGAVVGFGSNVATCLFAPKFVPSFRWVTGTWVTGESIAQYDPQRCLDVARKVMARRQVALTPAEEALFQAIPRSAALIERYG